MSPFTDPEVASATVHREGQALLAAVADHRGTPVPTCPGWDTDQLTRHLARVHRWATGFLLDARQGVPCLPHAIPRLLEDRDLVEEAERWLVELVSEVRLADPASPAWTFAGEASPVGSTAAFWVRRQVHETLVHRWDAEHAVGVASPIEAELATDALRELFDTMVPLRLSVGPLPAGGTVTFAGVGTFTVGEGDSHAEVAGSAEDMLLAASGRLPWSRVEIEGDAHLLTIMAEHLRF